MLSLWRNPVENIYSWFTRGWGERFFNRDPSNFTLMMEDNCGNIFPWYCQSNYQNCLDLNAVEKCVYIVLDLLKRSIESETKIPAGEKRLNIFFEDLCTQTDTSMKNICNFLNVEKSIVTEDALREARLPREIIQSNIDTKLSFFKGNINSDLYDKLVHFQESYTYSRYGVS